MKMSQYYSRTENKQCPQCGEPIPDDRDMTYCEKCRRAININARQREAKRKYLEEMGENTLDDMATEAHKLHLTYGQLQAKKIIERMRKES